MINKDVMSQSKETSEKKLILLVTLIITLFAVIVIFVGVFIKAVSGVHLSVDVVDDSVLLWHLENNTFHKIEATDTLYVEKFEHNEWVRMQTVIEPYVEDRKVEQGYGYMASEYFNLEYLNHNNFYQKYRLAKSYSIDGKEKLAYYEFRIDELTRDRKVRSITTVEQKNQKPYLLEMFQKDDQDK
ncbi:MAG: hypothetical protein RR036_02305 [Oscillospiraceae bacterium]